MIKGSRFTDNRVGGFQCWPNCRRGDGGAISSFGPLTVTNSTLANNFAMLKGGAIYGEGIHDG